MPPRRARPRDPVARAPLDLSEMQEGVHPPECVASLGDRRELVGKGLAREILLVSPHADGGQHERGREAAGRVCRPFLEGRGAGGRRERVAVRACAPRTRRPTPTPGLRVPGLSPPRPPRPQSSHPRASDGSRSRRIRWREPARSAHAGRGRIQPRQALARPSPPDPGSQRRVPAARWTGHVQPVTARSRAGRARGHVSGRRPRAARRPP